MAALHARAALRVFPSGLAQIASEDGPSYGEGLVGRLSVLVDALVGDELDAVSNDMLGARISALYTVVQRLEGERLRALREFDRRKAWLDAGARSAKGWLADTCGLTAGEAAGDVEAARQLDRLPQTAEALAAGGLSLRKAKVITRAAKQLSGKGDALLDAAAASAGDTDIRTLREAVDTVVDDLDAEAIRRDEHDAHARRRVTKRLLPDGSVAGEYRLDSINGEAWLTALNAMTRPEGPDDDRTPEQRAADAMAELAWQALDRGSLPAVGGERPHVSVLQPPGRDEPSQLDFTGSVSDDAARMLTCDSSVRRVVVRGKSEVLDVGRASRTPTAAQRRAVIARDRRCVGCGAPAGWCEVHHVKHWRDGGLTDLCNLALVCRRCHRKIHLEGWTVRLDADGRWDLVRPARHPAARHRQAVRHRAATSAAATGYRL